MRRAIAIFTLGITALSLLAQSGTKWVDKDIVTQRIRVIIDNHSTLPLWQFPRDVYRQALYSLAELRLHVGQAGPIGEYLMTRLDDLLRRAKGQLGEAYVLGDSPLALATALQTAWESDAASCEYVTRPTPRINDRGFYEEAPQGRPIRVFTRIDSRLMLEDLVAKLRLMTPESHYLFAYFTNNSTEGQQVCYAVSDNGLDFTPLNGGKPVLASDTISVSGGVRDPHILRGDDGWFRMVLTDMDWQKGKWSNRGIVMLKSRDLIHWQHTAVQFPARYAGRDAAKADAVWAPQTIYDPEVGKYMVYFSLHSPKDGPFPLDAVYYAYANDDFTDLEGDEPQRLFTFDGPTIDTDIVCDREGVYHVFFNTWGNGGTGRRQFLAQSLHHFESWTLVDGLMQPEGIKMSLGDRQPIPSTTARRGYWPTTALPTVCSTSAPPPTLNTLRWLVKPRPTELLHPVMAPSFS